MEPPSSCQKQFIYTNFDTSFTVVPCEVYFPNNINDIIEIVKTHGQKKIRASGSYHVFNDLSATNEIMIRTDKLNKILSVDRQNMTVTVEGGCRLYSLAENLAKYQLALHVLPAVADQSIVGAISTATHGSRADRGSLSDAITSILLVSADAKVIEINNTSELFPAVATSLGALGIIYSVTLQCEPLYDIEDDTKSYHWNHIEKMLDDMILDCPFTQISINHQNKMCELSLRKPFTTGTLTKSQNITPSRYITTLARRDVYYKMISAPTIETPYTEIEIAIPLNYVKHAIHDIFALLKNHRNIHFILPELLVRFSSQDVSSFLSMNSDNARTAYISIFGSAENSVSDRLLSLFKEYQDLMVNKYHGRPHFGKKHFLNVSMMKFLYPSYASYNVIKELLDPTGVFVNPYIERLFNYD